MLHKISPNRFLTASERALLLAIARAGLPAGARFPAADVPTVQRLERLLAGQKAVQRGYRALLKTIALSARLTTGRRFEDLAVDRQLAVLESWRKGGVARRSALRGVMMPLKLAHFDNPEFYRSVGCVYQPEPAGPERRPRYMTERVHRLADLTDGGEGHEQLECDVVVIGTGAGGAVVARELAEHGQAVIMLEEGEFFGRADFADRAVDQHRKLYRNQGATFSVGNAAIPIPVGKAVGGTTTINSGTCYRTPDRVLREWREHDGLLDMTQENLAPYYERVESVLQVETARAEHLGGVARVIARGCDALGYTRHNALQRNAPDCDGQGVCCFGCPTDAKRSTNVSYVPLALRAGAELFTGARAEEIVVEGGRAVGVVARSGNTTLTVRARAVVVACGALLTPVFLMDNGLCTRSRALGRNLSIHPAAAAFARFDEEIAGFTAIPQGYAIEEFHDEGILFEGAQSPLDIAMAFLPHIGPSLVDLAESADRVAMFGFMIEDISRGRVRSVRGQPAITYVVNDRDVARLKRGTEILTRVFLAAGAEAVYPMVHKFDEIRDEAGLEAFRRATLRASDFDLSAYHPLGTARMSADPSRSVVGPDNEAHELPGLYICDGSSVPSSVAVNPQVTIMALATRAADRLHERLS